MSKIRNFARFFNVDGVPVGDIRAVNDPEIFQMDIPPGTAGVEFFDAAPAEGVKPVDTINFVSAIFPQARASDYNTRYADSLRERGMKTGLLLQNGPGASRLLMPAPGDTYFVLGTRRELIMPKDADIALTADESAYETADGDDEPPQAFRRAVVSERRAPTREDYERTVILPRIVPVTEDAPPARRPVPPPPGIVIPPKTPYLH